MYYIKYLDMSRAILCSSSGGQNCIFTASGIVTLCERPYSAPVESGLQTFKILVFQSHRFWKNKLRYISFPFQFHTPRNPQSQLSDQLQIRHFTGAQLENSNIVMLMYNNFLAVYSQSFKTEEEIPAKQHMIINRFNFTAIPLLNFRVP
jgi:hypothetical protein